MNNNVLSMLGFTEIDIALLKACIFIAMIGSFVHALAIDTDFKRVPKLKLLVKGDKEPRLVQSRRNFIERLSWIIVRILVGAVIGFAVALYFMNILQPGIAATSKILLLALVMGYSAPKVLELLERKTIKVFDVGIPHDDE